MIDLVAIGHLTFDETPSGIRPGGSAYYAALTARRLGLSVGRGAWDHAAFLRRLLGVG